MNEFISRKVPPITQGNYWVVFLKSNHTDENGLRQARYIDCGFAHFDGMQWDRVDWDYWYGDDSVIKGKQNGLPTRN